MYFTRRGKANYYDCDQNNQLKISAAMKYMQQSSSEQLEYLGFSPEKLYREDMVFLLSKMCIKVHRNPLCAEELVIGTAPTTPRGARFVREFVIDSVEGERLISALSLWILVAPGSRKILRPASFPYPMDFQEPGLDHAISDIALPKGIGRGELAHSPSQCDIPIRYSHIDINGHVNNTVYADFVCDCLPHDQLMGQGLDTLVIAFQNEAKWGETVEIQRHSLAEGEFYLSGAHQQGVACFEALALLRKNP